MFVSTMELRRGSAALHLLEFLRSEILQDDLFLRLQLQQLESQAQKRTGNLRTIRPANGLELHCLVDDALRRQGETLLFPVDIVVDASPDHLLDQELRIGAVDLLRSPDRRVRHLDCSLRRRAKPPLRVLSCGLGRPPSTILIALVTLLLLTSAKSSRKITMHSDRARKTHEVSRSRGACALTISTDTFLFNAENSFDWEKFERQPSTYLRSRQLKDTVANAS